MSRTISGLEVSGLSLQVKEKHRNAQRLLKPLKVVIPYAPLLEFPSEWLRTRRDNERFLCLIEAICFLHQHQRQVKQAGEGERTFDYIEANVQDYRLAFGLAKEVLSHTLCDLSKISRELLGEILALAGEKAGQSKREIHEIIFSRREIREFTNWYDMKVRRGLVQLVDLEYLLQLVGSQGRACMYKLPEDVPYLEFSLRGLTTPEELEEKLVCGAVST